MLLAFCDRHCWYVGSLSVFKDLIAEGEAETKPVEEENKEEEKTETAEESSCRR